MGSGEEQSLINVLYIDDEPALLETGKIFLEELGGFSVSTAESAPEALKVLETAKFDAIISDYLMSGMDGLEFLRTVRESGSDIPFIIFTGKGREEVVIEALNAGADFYLQKGGDPRSQFTELVSKVRQAVRRRTAEKELRESEEHYRLLIENAISAVAVHDIVLDEKGKPVDYIFISANPAFEKATGLKVEEIIGRRVTEVIPGIEKTPFIEIYGKVALTGESVSFEQYSEPLDRYYYINAYQVSKGRFATVFNDITKKKKDELELISKNEELGAAYEQLTSAEEELRQNYKELEQSQIDLKESEGKYRLIVEAAFEGIWQMDEMLKTVFVNRSMAEMLGYTVREMLGKNIHDFIPEEEHADQDKKIKERKGGKRSRYERQFIRKDGTVFTARVSATPIIDELGQFKGSFALVTDITEHKMAEKALRDSEEKLRSFIDHLPDIIMVHRDGTILYTNPTLTESFDIRPEDLQDKSIFNYILPQYHAVAAEAMQKREETGQDIPYEIEIESPGGKRYTTLVRGTIIDYEGSPANLVVLTDITERKKTEEEIKELSLFRERIIDDPVVWIAVSDGRGYVTFWNKAAERISGYKSSEALGTYDIWNRIVPDAGEMEKITRKIDMIVKKQSAIEELPLDIRTKSGDERNLVLNLRAIGDEKLGTFAIVGMGVDITDIKNAENAVHEANNKLNMLTSVVRHDILNYLMACESYIQLMQMNIEDEKLLDFLKNMEISAKSIEKMIIFTREYQSMGVDEPAWRNIKTVVEEVKKEPIFRDVNIIDSSEPVEVFADALFPRVFFNLFDNSVRHGEKVSRIEVSSYEKEGEFVIVVEDDGVGIAKDEKEKIFKENYGKHTGFGLFLAREILSITDITISETGTEGKGARFEISVPKSYWRKG